MLEKTEGKEVMDWNTLTTAPPQLLPHSQVCAQTSAQPGAGGTIGLPSPGPGAQNTAEPTILLLAYTPHTPDCRQHLIHFKAADFMP